MPGMIHSQRRAVLRKEPDDGDDDDDRDDDDDHDVREDNIGLLREHRSPWKYAVAIDSSAKQWKAAAF